MAVPAEPSVDGRRARRARNRETVIDAMFTLLDAGRYPVSVDEIAEAAGVSPSSVFRYFDGLDDLQHETITRHFERFAPMFDLPAADGRDQRIHTYVDARLALYDAIGPIARVARARALDHAPLAEALQVTREGFTRQIGEHFGPDLAGCRRAERDDIIGLVDALTSFESWDLLHTAQRRSTQRIARAWATALDALLP